MDVKAAIVVALCAGAGPHARAPTDTASLRTGIDTISGRPLPNFPKLGQGLCPPDPIASRWPFGGSRGALRLPSPARTLRLGSAAP